MHFETQLIIDADRGDDGWEIVVRFGPEDCEAAFTDMSDAELQALAPNLGEVIIAAILREAKSALGQ